MKTIIDYTNAVKGYVDSKVSLDTKEITVDYSDIISIADALPVAAKDLKVKVDAVQDLHGYTKPWVGGAGKNKLPIARVPISIGGLTFSWQSDGSVKVSGTALNEVYFWFNHEQGYADILEDNTQYIASISGIPSTLTNLEYQVAERATSTSTLTYLVSKSSDGAATFTTNSNPYCRDARLHIPNGTNLATPIYIKMMVRLATESDATFEPYFNICPITGHSQAKVTRAGRNLVDVTQTSVPSSSDATISNITSSGFTAAINSGRSYPSTRTPLSLESGKDYILSLKVTAISGSNIKIGQRNASNIFVKTITLPSTGSYEMSFTYSNGEYISLFENTGSSSGGTITISEFMVRLATDTNTVYEPYKGEVFTIDLDGTRYGGTLDVTSGVLTVIDAIIDLGDLTWTLDSGRAGHFYTNAISGIKNEGYGLCTAYEVDNEGANTTKNGIISLVQSYGSGRIFAVNTDYTDGGDFKTSVTGQKLVYELATPQTIRLTPAEVKLLQGYNTLFADSGDISLTYNSATFGNIVEEVGELEDTLTNEVETRAKLGAHNLLPSINGTMTIGGITFTKNSDGSVTANGTNTSGATVSYYMSSSTDTDANLTYPEGKYILTGAPSGGGSAGNYKWFLSLFYNKNAANNYGIFDFGSGAEYTLTSSNNTGVGVRIGIAAGQTVENLKFKPMLRLASDSDTTYQPYAMTNKELTEAKANKSDLASISITGTTNSTGSTIASGTYFYLNGQLVRAKTSIANGATLTANTNYVAVSAGALSQFLPITGGTVTGNLLAATLGLSSTIETSDVNIDTINGPNGYIYRVHVSDDSTGTQPTAVLGGNGYLLMGFSEITNNIFKYGVQIAFGFASSKITIRNAAYNGSGATWSAWTQV